MTIFGNALGAYHRDDHARGAGAADPSQHHRQRADHGLRWRILAATLVLVAVGALLGGAIGYGVSRVVESAISSVTP